MAVTRRIFIAILLTFLLVLTYISYRKTLSEPTAFEEAEVEHQAIFPSFTICPRADGVMDNFTNFKDVMEALEYFKQNGFEANFHTAGKGVEKEEYDLKNASVLASKFNARFNEVWNYAAIVQPYKPPKCITLCVTINVPNVGQPRQGEHAVFIITSINSHGAFYYERHEHGNSKQNYDFDTTSGFNMLGNFKLSVEMLKQTDTTFLKKSTYDCYEDNSMKMTNCMNDFYAKELGCKLPWDTESKLVDLKNCETATELDTFRNLSYFITSKTLTSKVEKYGCLKPNCRKITWKKAQHTEVYDQPGQPGHKLLVAMPHNAKVLRRQEVKLADMGSFVADCGSYLGLFVGASILSITDILIHALKKLRKICN